MEHKIFAVSDVPPPVGTKAFILWNGISYDGVFKGVSKKTGMWEFDVGDERFFLVPGSKYIRGYS